MVETLILGTFLGAFITTIVSLYISYKNATQPYVIKSLSEGYELIAIDRKFDNDKYTYAAIRKNDKIIAAVRLDDRGVKDICYDVEV